MNIGMVFGAVFTLILISAIVVFAFYVINGMQETQIYAQIEDAKDNLETAVTNHYYNTGTGSTATYTLSIPSGSRFCFIDPSDPSSNMAEGWNPNDIVPSMIINNEYNLWIYYPQSIGDQDGKKISHMNVSANFCSVNGAKLKLENLGNRVEVSPKT